LNVAVAAGIVLYQWALWANLAEVQLSGAKYCVEHEVGLLIGTYTSTMGHVDGKGEGVYKAVLNPHSGLLTKLQLLLPCRDPSYVSMVGEDAFVAVDETSGDLKLADLATGSVKQTIQNSGKWPCHVFCDDNNVS
jgi:6-phosphogluconolactonase